LADQCFAVAGKDHVGLSVARSLLGIQGADRLFRAPGLTKPSARMLYVMTRKFHSVDCCSPAGFSGGSGFGR